MNVTTRSEAHSVMRNSPYPYRLKDGRKLKVFTEELFIASGGDYTRGDAEKHLNDIRTKHDSEHGWVCDPNNEGGHEGIFEEIDRKTGRKLFYAWRHHAVYE